MKAKWLVAAIASVIWLGMAWQEVSAQEDFRVCTDQRTYPPKVVIVCGDCQCPPGYY